MGQEHHWSDLGPYPPELQSSGEEKKGRRARKPRMTYGYVGLRPLAMPRWEAEKLLAAAAAGELVDEKHLKVAQRRVKLKTK